MSQQIDEIIKSLHEAFLAVEPGIWECVKDAARKVEDAPRPRRGKGPCVKSAAGPGPKGRRDKNAHRGGKSSVPKPPGLP